MPGSASPVKRGCFSSPTDFAYRYCDLGNVYLVVSGDQIAQTFVAVYGSDLTLGNLVNAWGAPTGADYTSFAISLYWPDRFAYVSGPFSPSSCVRTIAYGKPRRVVGRWRGYLSTDRAQ